MTGRKKRITGRKRWKTTAEERGSIMTCPLHIDPGRSMEEILRLGVSMNHTIAEISQDILGAEIEAINHHGILFITESNSHNGLQYCYDHHELATF